MNDANLKVLAKIIIAVETGGQVYGKGRYNDLTLPYTNSSKEYTITLGAGGFYGDEGETLVQMIHDADITLFKKLDTCNPSIESMLQKNWHSIKWNPSTAQRIVLVKIIDTELGHLMQDELMAKKVSTMVVVCQKKYPTADIKAQMMYAEISHLGGANAVARIFDRVIGEYSLDNIMVSLVKDQKSENKNLVGSQKYWSRHLKCRQFIDEYAQEENNNMAVIIGSARSDENGNATGGKAGDQKQTSSDDWEGEVSKQYWYLHSKGWYVIRAKDPEVREKIARGMEIACSNKNYGYNQGQNRSAWDYLKNLDFDMAKLDTPKETDCAQLVRLCIRYAGIKSDDFYTATEKDALKKTGKFTIYTSDKYCKSSDYLLRGDILVTRSKGHTVVVLTNGAKAKATPVTPEPVKPSAPTVTVSPLKTFQTFLNTNYSDSLKAFCGGLLEVDGVYGPKTRAATLTVWKYMVNKYYHMNLTLGNFNFFEASKIAADRVPMNEIKKHPTFAFILQGILSGRKYYKGEVDGQIGSQTLDALIEFKKVSQIGSDSTVTSTVWYKLFN